MLVAYHGSFHDGKELYTMSKMKRQDSKGRNLRLGESQRKDGRYVYKYTDIFG
ncbi:integrase DNA-binding domain-containing protein, partial [[Clostridium] innocuum]